VVSSPIARPRGTTDKLRTTTTNSSTTARRPDHIRLSALVRSRSAQFIVHASSQLGRGPPKRGHFSAILAGFSRCWYAPILGQVLVTTLTCLRTADLTKSELFAQSDACCLSLS